MRFLVIADFDAVIDRDILYDLIDYPDVVDPLHPTTEEQEFISEALAKLDLAERAAIGEADGFLSSRYNSQQIFQKTGVDRSSVLLLRITDMTLYHLHGIVNPKSIPALRAKKYNEALDWFEQVQEGKVNPSDLPKVIDGSKDHILFGSNPKRDHYV